MTKKINLSSRNAFIFTGLFILSCLVTYPFIKQYTDSALLETKVSGLQKDADQHKANIDALKDYEVTLDEVQKKLTQKFYSGKSDPYWDHRFVEEQNHILANMPAHSLVNCMILEIPDTVLRDMVEQITECRHSLSTRLSLELVIHQKILGELLPMQAQIIGRLGQ